MTAQNWTESKKKIELIVYQSKTN